MKKNSIVLLATLSMIGVAEANAQMKFAFSKGFAANAVVSDFTLAGKNETGFGASLSNSDKLEISRHIALQAEFHLHYSASQNVKYWGLEVPIYVVGHLKMGSGKGFGGAGSYADYGLQSKNWAIGGGGVGTAIGFANGFFLDFFLKRGFFGWGPRPRNQPPT